MPYLPFYFPIWEKSYGEKKKKKKEQKLNKSMFTGFLWSTQENNTFNPREPSLTKRGGGDILPHICKDQLPLLQKRLPRILILGHTVFSGLDSLLRQLRLMLQCQKRAWNAVHTEIWSRIQIVTNGGQEQPCTVCASHCLHFDSLWLQRNTSFTGYLGQVSER